MENYSMLFPTSSSSYFSSLQPAPFSPGMIGAQALDHFQGNSPAGGSFMAVKEDDFIKAASSDVSHGDPLTEANTCGSDEVKPAKKGGIKKVRKPRFAFQTRSQVDILDDGYRWRKYGQKAVKNNRFPRSYYRCTHHGCSVKKQVQRLSKDEGIVVTTYEGTHTHPIEKSNDNFEHILSQMQIYNNF